MKLLLYVAFIYLRECKTHHLTLKKTWFDELLMLGITEVILDAVTAYTVNHLDTVPPLLNRILHTLFLASLDAVIFILCLYVLAISDTYPKKSLEEL